MLISFPLMVLMNRSCANAGVLDRNEINTPPTRREIEIKSKTAPCTGSIRSQINDIIERNTEVTETLVEIISKFLFLSLVVNTISSPQKVILPSSTSHVASPMAVSEVTDLPQPDSPTIPIIWPSSTVRLTS